MGRLPGTAENVLTAKITELRREGLATRVMLHGPLTLEASIEPNRDIGNLRAGDHVVVRLPTERIRLFRWDRDASA